MDGGEVGVGWGCGMRGGGDDDDGFVLEVVFGGVGGE